MNLMIFRVRVSWNIVMIFLPPQLPPPPPAPPPKKTKKKTAGKLDLRLLWIVWRRFWMTFRCVSSASSCSQVICSYLKCGQVHSNKPMRIRSAGSPSCWPGSVQLNCKLILTAKRWRSKQKNAKKYISSNKLPNNDDAVRKAREAHLIHKGNTLFPLGMIRRDKAHWYMIPPSLLYQ